METWLPVTLEAFSHAYEISSIGNVRSKTRTYEHGRTQHGRVLRQVLVKGYNHVLLQAKPHKRMIRTHILVALAFIGEPPGKIAPNGWQVNHKNGIKTDNSAENLEWVTQAENRQHAISSGRFWCRGEHQHLAKLTTDKVRNIRKRFARGETVMELSKAFGVTWGAVNGVVKHRTWKHVTD